VIVASYVQVWHLKPEVDIRIVHFTFSLRRVLFLSRAGDYYELLAKPTCRVAMPWVFHRVALDELVMIVNLDLIQCIQSFIITLVVSAANQEKLLSVWILYTLEIVRKTAIIVWLHLYRLNGLVPDV